MTARPNHRPAFTLVEVLIVVVLMGLLAAGVIASFTPVVHERMEATAQIVVGDVAYVRSLAVTNNSTYRLTFSPSSNLYALDHSGPEANLNTLPTSSFWAAGATANQQLMDLDKLPLGAPLVQLIGATKNSAAPALVTDLEFGPLGGTTRSEDTTIWLACGQGSERRYLSIHIDPITGLAGMGEFVGAPPAVVQAAEVALGFVSNTGGTSL